MRIALSLLIVLSASFVLAQDQTPANPPAPAHHKVLTPEQQEYQRQFSAFMDQRHVLQSKAQKAYSDEMAREKNDPCIAESTTRGSEECLGRESKLTDANYTEFTDAIREILTLKGPQFGSGPTTGPATGPTGTPLTSDELVKGFDTLESAWQEYRGLVPKTAYDQYKGGTLAPVFGGECSQMIVRSHMRELYMIYESPIRM
jgi:hypothetical protein